MSLVSMEVAEKLTPALRQVAERLEGAGRVEASRAMGEEVQTLVVSHLIELAGTRHATANRLGATPTNFISGAAEAAAAAGVVQADGDGVSLHLRHPVVARAFRDIHIAPKTGKFLTIPMNAIAYGRRAREFDKVQFVHRGEEIRQDIAAYLLVRSVTQQQDRTLMPSFDEINTAAAAGLRFYVRRTLQQASLSS